MRHPEVLSATRGFVNAYDRGPRADPSLNDLARWHQTLTSSPPAGKTSRLPMLGMALGQFTGHITRAGSGWNRQVPTRRVNVVGAALTGVWFIAFLKVPNRHRIP